MTSARKRFDAAILVGRFQPFHNAHAALLRAALASAGRVVVALGSAFSARNIRNPFTAEERATMIRASLDDHAAGRVSFVFVRDYYDDHRWAKAVENGVRAEMERQGLRASRAALAGFHKDATSDYLRLFPQWSRLALERQGNIDASAIRQTYFTNAADSSWTALVPPAVAHFLKDVATRADFVDIQEEYRAALVYREKWGEGPFVTLDAVVTAAGHVALVRRKNAPGRGLWAIPGGFLEGRERLFQGAVRELKEETGLDMPEADFIDALRDVAVFDHPDRSARGRILTHAHWFDLPLAALPAIHGADDAAEARWFPTASLPAMETALFEDHFHILDHFLRLLSRDGDQESGDSASLRHSPERSDADRATSKCAPYDGCAIENAKATE